MTLSIDACFSPIPFSENNRSALATGIATLVLCHTRYWHTLTTPGHISTLHSVPTLVSPLHRFATRPPSCTLGIEIRHPALRPRNERLALLDLNVQRRIGSTLIFFESNALLRPSTDAAPSRFSVFSWAFGSSASGLRRSESRGWFWLTAFHPFQAFQRSSVFVKVTSAVREQRHERPRTPSIRTRLNDHCDFVGSCWETVDQFNLNEVFEIRFLLQHGRFLSKDLNVPGSRNGTMMFMRSVGGARRCSLPVRAHEPWWKPRMFKGTWRPGTLLP